MKQPIVIIITILFVYLQSGKNLFAQEREGVKINELLIKADRLFKKNKFFKAKSIYNKILKVDSVRAEAIYRQEICNLRLKHSKPNCDLLLKAVNLGYKVDDAELFFYGCKAKKDINIIDN